MHFGSSEGNRGLKYGSCGMVYMDIFWNCPLGLKGLKKNIRTKPLSFS